MARTNESITAAIAVIGIDIGKNVFHLIGLDKHGRIQLKTKLSRGQLDTHLANTPPCLIGMEACNGAHHLSRKLIRIGHDARLMTGQIRGACLPLLRALRQDLPCRYPRSCGRI